MWIDLSLGKGWHVSVDASSSLFEFNDRKMLVPMKPSDDEAKTHRIFASGLEADGTLVNPEEQVHGHASIQSLMGSMVVVPGDVDGEFMADLIQSKGDEDVRHAFFLHGSNEALNDSDASVFPNGTETLTDLPGLGPSFEVVVTTLSFLGSPITSARSSNV